MDVDHISNEQLVFDEKINNERRTLKDFPN